MNPATRTTLLVFILAVVIGLYGIAFANTNTKPVTVDDIVNIEFAGEFDISPDGKWVVWVKTSPDKEKSRRKTNIFLSSTEDTTVLEITRSTKNDHSPKFSPDGSRLAYLSRLDKSKTQIYLYDIRGGEPKKITSVPNGVNQFAWRDDNEIVFSAREDSTRYEQKLKKAKDTTVIVADQEHYPPVRLFELSLKDEKVTRLTTNRGAITEFDISPGGRWVVMNENVDVNYTYDHRNPPRQFLMDLSTGDRKEILTAPHVDPYNFKWNSQGRGIYCRRPVASDSTDTYVSIGELYYFELDTGAFHRIDTGGANGLGRTYVVVEDGVVAALAGGVRDEIVHLRMDGHRAKKRYTVESVAKQSIRLSTGTRNGNRIVYSVSNASTVPVNMTATVRKGALKNENEIAKINKHLKKKTLARSEIVRWTGSLDDEVEGVLFYPLDYEDGKKYPLIASIHGGPTGVDPDFFSERWSNYPHMLSSKGTFVFQVNYHGSGNYGLRWAESIKGHYYDYEVPDILTGIDYLIERGLVDPDRLGIMGWSNGSILGIEACMRSDRFKVLSAGAGDVNWTSDYGNCRFGGGFDNAYFGGAPWDIPEIYVEKSPFFRMRDLKTPTLIMFGSNDTSVPTEQGWEHFRAMQQIGTTPVRFLLFPGEGHGPRKLAHQKRKMEEELDWFDKYLFDTYEEKNEAFDDKSLPAFSIEKSKIARSDALYGETKNGVVIPELVEAAGLKIGRFEVTRAQYKAFKPDYEIAPGTENHPANGISFEDAGAYCGWLSNTTEQTYRLPTTDEMKKLVKLAKSNLGNENNLERWVGYTPTPDEMAMLDAKIEELEKNRLLIEDVGSMRSVGDPGVYDLGGNVAEWATNGDGGKVMGLSAVSSRDKRAPYVEPRTVYIGFRVCRE